jgi:hypothetical protein
MDYRYLGSIFRGPLTGEPIGYHSRYNATGVACQNESNAERPDGCLGRSLVDLLDFGALPTINGAARRH